MDRQSHVLIVEDEIFQALYLRTQLARAGIHLVDIARTVDQAMSLIAAHDFDCAVLDIKLQKETVFAVADKLLAQAVPFVFTTVHSAGVIPRQYEQCPVFAKPLIMIDLVQALLDYTDPDRRSLKILPA